MEEIEKKARHKKCDLENVGNYRPICSLLALYKLFSTMLYGRFFHDSTKNKLKIRLDSARQRITLRHTG